MVLFPLNFKSVTCTCNAGSELNLGEGIKPTKRLNAIIIYLCNPLSPVPTPMKFLSLYKVADSIF